MGGCVSALQGAELVRYQSLIYLCENIDPYEVNVDDLSDYGDLIPYMHLRNICDYLVVKHSAYTLLEMADYESSLPYAHLTDGTIDWVKFLSLESGKVLCFTEVQYYLSCYSISFKCWTLIEGSGTVVGGWCSCDEGFTQCCSHVGALLFALEYDYTLNVGS